jgi:hypothetical protein
MEPFAHWRPERVAIGVGRAAADIELMPLYQDFGFPPPPRLEAVAQHANEKEGNCNHATIIL